MDNRISRALASEPVASHRALLDRFGRYIVPEPLIFKYLSDSLLRLFFTVAGGGDEIKFGNIVALVVLHDFKQDRTLFAHPVFASPEASPLLKHIDGPMTRPSVEAGQSWEQATRRYIEHKRALWERFEGETKTLRRAEASRRWREALHWALVRLHYCDQCDACRWEGTVRNTVAESTPPSTAILSPEEQATVQAIVGSDMWRMEIDYAHRGDFVVEEMPRFLQRFDERFTIAAFPARLPVVQGGAIVGMAAYYDHAGKRVRYVHELTAGCDGEMLFRFGEQELGLPSFSAIPTWETDLHDYGEWRREAWMRFWIEELEFGIAEASRHWIDDYWVALQRLLHIGDSNPVTDVGREMDAAAHATV